MKYCWKCMWRGLDGIAKCYATFADEKSARALSNGNAKVLESFQFWVEESK